MNFICQQLPSKYTVISIGFTSPLEKRQLIQLFKSTVLFLVLTYIISSQKTACIKPIFGVARIWTLLECQTISCLNGRDRIVVSTSRCGRDNPGSNPGHGRGCEVSIMALPDSNFSFTRAVKHHTYPYFQLLP